MLGFLNHTKALISGPRTICTSALYEAARKGTRMKREAMKKASKKEVVKKVFIPYTKRLEMQKVGKISPRVDDVSREFPVDDVYLREMFRWPIYSIEETMKMHRETVHPTMFNMPQADIFAEVELSMSADKKNQYLDSFTNILLLPHQYDVEEERTILVLCKSEEMVEKVRQMGVTLCLGPEVVKLANKGELDINSYEYVLAHSSILPDIIPLRNLIKKKFPSPKLGTAGADIEAIVTRFSKGVKYTAVKDKYDHDFAKVVAKIGTVDMDEGHIEANFKSLIRDIEENRPKARTADVITLAWITCDSNEEKFKVDHNLYRESSKPSEEQEEGADDVDPLELRESAE